MRNELDMLRQSLADGTISKETLQNRLTAIIEEAYQRLPVDTAFIADCESLLQTIITGNASTAPSIAVDCWKTIRTNTRTHKSASLSWKARFSIMAAAFVLLIGLQWFFFGRTWLGGKSAYGGTTYIIGTHRMDSGLSAAIANEWAYDDERRELNTQSWEELTSFLGYEPPTVNVSAFGLNPNGYYYGSVSKSDCSSHQSYSTCYADNTVRWLDIAVIDYVTPDKIGFSFSQLRPGKNVTLPDGTEVYVATVWNGMSPVDKRGISVTWLDGTRVYHLIGGLTEQEMLAAAEELCRQ